MMVGQLLFLAKKTWLYENNHYSSLLLMSVLLFPCLQVDHYDQPDGQPLVNLLS